MKRKLSFSKENSDLKRPHSVVSGGMLGGIRQHCRTLSPEVFNHLENVAQNLDVLLKQRNHQVAKLDAEIVALKTRFEDCKKRLIEQVDYSSALRKEMDLLETERDFLNDTNCQRQRIKALEKTLANERDLVRIFGDGKSDELAVAEKRIAEQDAEIAALKTRFEDCKKRLIEQMDYSKLPVADRRDRFAE